MRGRGWLGIAPFLVGTPAVAEPYLGASIGVNTFIDPPGDVQIVEDGKANYGVMIGYRLDRYRFELEAEQTETNFEVVDGSEDNDLKLRRYTISLYYDFRQPSAAYSPYVGAGIGVATAKATENDAQQVFVEEDNSVFTAHAEIGLDIKVMPHFHLGSAYRFSYVDTDDVTNKVTKISSFQLSARLVF